ncbi:eukaryotic translation initiation factor 4H-like [Lineus longissimus]|uniref:eukaryotic translation initiation factor 4H-like n=1 Tax=Lineus longissimus TaxID=88925 RepID=UPI002B4E4E92
MAYNNYGGGGRDYNNDRDYGDRGGYSGGGGGGGYGNRGPRQEQPIPDEPPFKAFVGNLPGGMVQGDFDVIFSTCKVKSANLVHDRDTELFRGFAYVEFADQESLREALAYDKAVFCDKQIKVNVAIDRNRGERGRGRGRGDRGGFGRGGGRGRDNYGGNDDFGDRRGGGGYRGGRSDRGYSGGGRGGGGGGGWNDRDNDDSRGGGGRYGNRPRNNSGDDEFKEPDEASRAARPKLKLLPRSVPKDAPKEPPTGRSDIFGGGKPREAKGDDL